jgi:hypothetical protein
VVSISVARANETDMAVDTIIRTAAPNTCNIRRFSFFNGIVVILYEVFNWKSL